MEVNKPEESALSRIRKERCPEGCGKNLPLLYGFARADLVQSYFHRDADSNKVFCTAPSAEQLVEELAGRLAEVEKDGARLDWLDNQGDLGNILIDPDLPGDTTAIYWNRFPGGDASQTVRSAIDAARAQKENTDAK